MSPTSETTIRDWIRAAWIKRPTHKGIENGFELTGEADYPISVTAFVEVEIDGSPKTFRITCREIDVAEMDAALARICS